MYIFLRAFSPSHAWMGFMGLLQDEAEDESMKLETSEGISEPPSEVLLPALSVPALPCRNPLKIQ